MELIGRLTVDDIVNTFAGAGDSCAQTFVIIHLSSLNIRAGNIILGEAIIKVQNYKEL